MNATYIRISHVSQNTISQESKAIGEKYVDKISGIVPFEERPNASRLLSDIAIGKVKHVYVTRLDRLGRVAFGILKTIEFFKEKKCQLTVTSLNLNLFENGKVNHMFMLMISIYAQLAEQYREEIKERTQEGIEIAKREGKFRGRKKDTKENSDKFLSKHRDIINCVQNGMSLNKIVETTKKSKPTVIKVKKLINK